MLVQNMNDFQKFVNAGTEPLKMLVENICTIFKDLKGKYNFLSLGLLNNKHGSDIDASMLL